MGLIAKVLETIRTKLNNNEVTDIKCDPGYGANQTPLFLNSPGEDSNPLPNDFLLSIELEDGQTACIGTVDRKNKDTSEPGEVRRYGRNSSGDPVVEFYLKKDGTAIVENDNGKIELKTNGQIDLNGCIIETDGTLKTNNIEASLSCKVGPTLSELVAHVHAGVTVGAGSTGPLV